MLQRLRKKNFQDRQNGNKNPKRGPFEPFFQDPVKQSEKNNEIQAAL
jgi:hypothetical protein